MDANEIQNDRVHDISVLFNESLELEMVQKTELQ